MKPLFLLKKGTALLGRNGLTLEGLAPEFKKIFPREDPRYIDDVSKLAGVAAGHIWKDGGSPDDGFRKSFAVIMGTAFGAIDPTVAFDAQALQKGPNAVNPMDFPNTVANAAGSRIGIWLQLKGPNVTLTNGGTSFLDALGFAFQGMNFGLFQDCFTGAVDKVPSLLKPAAAGGMGVPEYLEGCCLFLASGSPKENCLGRITDYFSLQLGADLGLPPAFSQSFGALWKEVKWLGCPAGMPLESQFPQGIARYSPSPSVMELGLGGSGSLDAFLEAPFPCGVIATFSKPERKISFIKVEK